MSGKMDKKKIKFNVKTKLPVKKETKKPAPSIAPKKPKFNVGKKLPAKPKLDLEEVGIMGGRYYRDRKTGKYYIDRKGTETSMPKDPTRGGKFHVFVTKYPLK
tara:strand:+ start:368 stop:676 length:309 start_codon:yes stop_codon:yes gene_type:complete